MMFTHFLILISSIFSSPETAASDCISTEEMKLYNLINKYRKEEKLSPIPLSAKLTLVARTHARDLVENYNFDPQNRCNPHSWSDKGNWTPCCYTIDHAEAECMWNKPREIAGYMDNGYEIAFYQSSGAKAEAALMGWQTSKFHNPIIVNEGIWKQVNWNAIGIGIYKEYAIVWFGELKDAEKPEDCR